MTEPEQNISELAGKAGSGDRAALEDLLGLFQGRLESWVRIRLGSHLRGKVETEDVVQETLLRALRSWDRFHWQGEEAFANWLCRISENVIRENAKRALQRPEASLDVEPPADSASQTKAHRRNERFERLKTALNALPPDHREVIVLSRLDGLPLKDVAKRMKRSPNAISHLLIRAMKSLKESIGDTESYQLPARSLQAEREAEDGV